MSRIGLCSVTLRAQTPAAVVEHAAAAGLESIEWGSDVHVPVGAFDLARDIGSMTREAGMTVASYGSYLGFPWATAPFEQPADAVATAVALGAPRIRLWAGPLGSGDTNERSRRTTIAMLRETARLAADAGISVATEFHDSTLADTAASTLLLLDTVGGAGLSTYWQPRIGASDDEALADFDALASHVSAVHVFSWDERARRMGLVERESMWRRVVARCVELPAVTDLLIEFVPDDDPALVASEAGQLRTWRDEALVAAGSTT